MSYELPANLIPVFTHHYERGWKLLQAVVILEGQPLPKPGFWARRKGRRAIRHLQKCLQMLPQHWPAR